MPLARVGAMPQSQSTPSSSKQQYRDAGSGSTRSSRTRPKGITMEVSQGEKGISHLMSTCHNPHPSFSMLVDVILIYRHGDREGNSSKTFLDGIEKRKARQTRTNQDSDRETKRSPCSSSFVFVSFSLGNPLPSRLVLFARHHST
jgi:hypothetical protein